MVIITLEALPGALLVSRRHVDLSRVASALCSR
ncbi:putative leader peptide [Marinactinospora thermotolerans]